MDKGAETIPMPPGQTGGSHPGKHYAVLLTDLNLQVRALGWNVVTKQESDVMYKAIVYLSFTATRTRAEVLNLESPEPQRVHE